MGLGQGMGRRRRMRRFQQEHVRTESPGGPAEAPATAPIDTHIAHVDGEKCVGCGDCARACPFGAVTVQNGKAHVDASQCRGCRVCTRACPTGAIS